MNFLEELRWRGLLFDMIPGTEEHLAGGCRLGYIGFDPSAPSLHVGNLLQITLLLHFQRAGHQPVALVGGATGMIGDPSGKSEERKLLDEETIRFNEKKIGEQLTRFLDFGPVSNPAILTNNYNWFRNLGLLEFLRDTGKHLSVNYMLAKDSVKNRLDSGISFTEFTYQLLQGYDFFHLNRTLGCTVQMGGSDQWGNITAGIELTRRKCGQEVYAITSPLITNAEGKKLGKTEHGAVYLDADMTSPFRFYQFWFNVSDDEARRYIRYFSLLSQDEIENLEASHLQSPGSRLLQKALARDLTVRVHSQDDYQHVVKASEIIFGQATAEILHALSEQDFDDIFEGVPSKTISRSDLESGMDILKLLADETKFFPSRAEARRTIQSQGVSVNKKIVGLDHVVSADQLIKNRYLVLQKGKKNYFLVVAG